jgi:segregation and condensation protein A
MLFRVNLDIFRGPLDLLLYLVRKHEVDVRRIPVARIADQYIQHLDVLQQIDVNAVGDFIEIASILIEIKSRLVLPQVEEATDEQPLDDLRNELVERLLEYKKYKDAACILEENSQRWQQRYTRLGNDLPPREVASAEQPIREVELWDLVSALGRVMRQNEKSAAPTIVYDETPISVYMQQLHDRLITEQRVCFSDMFQPGMAKSKMIGVFLAILELARNYNVLVEQDGMHSEIHLCPGENFRPRIEISEIHSAEFDDERTSELTATDAPKPR